MIILEKYDIIKHKIEEGDILLFRSNGLIGKLIGISTATKYSHVGIASYSGGIGEEDTIIECVEFKEGSILSGLFGMAGSGGGRSVNLEEMVKQNPNRIDVYRPNKTFYNYHYNHETKEIQVENKEYNSIKVTRCMRRLTGLPYGWKRIWWILKRKLIMWNLLFSNHSSTNDDSQKALIYPVCSTALSYCFSRHGYDLVTNRSDEWTEPGDFAKSPCLNYLFTLMP